MAGFDFPGGVGGIDIEDVAAMDGSGSIAVSFSRKQFVKEGSEFPDPEALTAELGDDREGRLGLDQPLSIRVKHITTSNFDTLEDACEDHTDLWIKVKSFATVDGSSTPLFTVTYKEVILSNATHGPAKVDRDAYGVSILDGKCTGYRTSDIMEVTRN
jgi:hypothetical protein